jgi:MFS family permease
LAAASFGVGVGVSSLLTYNSGLFFDQLSRDFGLSRTGFGLVYFATTVVLAITMPWVGRLIDHRGVRWPTAFGAMGLSISYIALATMTRSIASYAVLMLLLGLVGAPSSSVGFTRAVTGLFDRGRGLALGITQAGIGISATLVPLLVGLSIQHHGWRGGYFTLAAISLLGVPSALLFLKTDDRNVADVRKSASDAAFRLALRTRLFWLQASVFTLVTLAFVGIVVHFVPMLEQRGVPPLRAASYAGLIGFSVLVSRLAIGWLADMVHAPWLGAISCALGAAGCLALVAPGQGLIPFAAVAIGCAVGAEIDLLGYLTSRNFGPEIYGRVYAWQYAAVICASGASPAWVGLFSDRSGYAAAAGLSALLSVVAMLLFLLLPALPRQNEPEVAANGEGSFPAS